MIFIYNKSIDIYINLVNFLNIHFLSKFLLILKFYLNAIHLMISFLKNLFFRHKFIKSTFYGFS